MRSEARCGTATVPVADTKLYRGPRGSLRVAFQTMYAPIEVARAFYCAASGGERLHLKAGMSDFAVRARDMHIEMDGPGMARVAVKGPAQAIGGVIPAAIDIARGDDITVIASPPCAPFAVRSGGGKKIPPNIGALLTGARASVFDWTPEETKDGVQRPAGYNHVEAPEECKACGGAFHPSSLKAGACRTCRPPERGAPRPLADQYAAIHGAAMKLGRTLW